MRGTRDGAYLIDKELDVVGRDLLAGEVHEVVHVDFHQLRDDVDLVEGRDQRRDNLVCTRGAREGRKE